MTTADFLAEWNNSATTILVYTSGSTGTPKPMWVEKTKMLNSARITCDFLHLKPNDTALLCMSLNYIAGKMMMVRSIERHLRLIEVTPSNHPLATITTDIDFAAMIPSQVFCSLQVPEERERLCRIRNLIIGGGAITEELQAAINNVTWRGNVFSTYGMTETLSHIALRQLNGPSASEWYIPFDNVEITLDADSCLCINAPLVHDGILKTNDIAEIHPDDITKPGGRRFRIIGRKDNVICSGGIKLHIEKIEDILRPYIHHPFCITKRKDEKFGEVAVMLLATHDTPDLSEAYKHLDRFSQPKDIILTDKIPMTETGKIDRLSAIHLANKNRANMLVQKV